MNAKPAPGTRLPEYDEEEFCPECGRRFRWTLRGTLADLVAWFRGRVRATLERWFPKPQPPDRPEDLTPFHPNCTGSYARFVECGGTFADDANSTRKAARAIEPSAYLRYVSHVDPKPKRHRRARSQPKRGSARKAARS